VNLEAANAGGFTSHPDSYYRTWPKPITPQEEKTGGYLRNLTTEESLSVFLTIRAACLKAGGATKPAVNSAAAAYRLAPNLGEISLALTSALETVPAERSAVTRHEMRELEETIMHNRRMAGQMSVNPHIPNPAFPGQYPTQHEFSHPTVFPQPHQAKHPNSSHEFHSPQSAR
jgi:hypothetical protein